MRGGISLGSNIGRRPCRTDILRFSRTKSRQGSEVYETNACGLGVFVAISSRCFLLCCPGKASSLDRHPSSFHTTKCTEYTNVTYGRPLTGKSAEDVNPTSSPMDNSVTSKVYCHTPSRPLIFMSAGQPKKLMSAVRSMRWVNLTAEVVSSRVFFCSCPDLLGGLANTGSLLACRK